MEIIDFRTPGLGDQSYLVAHEGHAVLVDPQRDVGRFLEAADERGLEVRFVLETHLHNDYLSGGRIAAARTGAELVMPAGAAPVYRHTPAFHLEDLPGPAGMTIRPVHTPGHTPEHTSYVVLVDGEPVAVFSGGSLLVASAGRTDLLGPERARTLARLQYGSVHRLAGLPREVGLYPTHGEGSFCTVSGAGRHTSTIGAERDTNPLLALPGAEEFADGLLAVRPPIPAFYAHMGPGNLRGTGEPPAAPLPELTAADALALPGVHLVDVRPRAAQAEGFLPGSLGIELGDDFGSWAGWLLPYGAPVVLVADRAQDVAEARVQLARIGFDDVRGVVHDLGGRATARFTLLDLDEARPLVPGTQVLDVRMPQERADLPLPGASERFVPDLVTEGVPDGLDPARPVLVACGSGRRAAIAASLLVREGFTVLALTGAAAPDLA
ncbi:glyoxylase-like metal-dependent hydrolase (beta-lactamase superfamily II) [Actinocorallia herbida]|uniref:Glyoxylase-like metal-dependent hydrolase (Beta-lactamase superfamily II) n=1 Tax=Actinocorallia herbida TaxID=58109 RepID=A0A3N1D532_9ACTN|nr:MBL fold metallo-hydrolase [Actinocorallia herbida]ROO88651.1 glyoxylase-like metal-dependent hydrolase (beta-lactamase superfamily II) [Actinocorallia herbida]